ncbi:S8 family serine peptidase [Streptomyces sp. NPDC088354]|uniref:S8 family serine peptidase n=1 Tax=Streptomyces sp. NPDC088354 TaxID=3365856 RepID=UPI0038265D58
MDFSGTNWTVHLTISGTRRASVRFAHMNSGKLVDRSQFPGSDAIDRTWAWGDSRGAGVRVCVIDSGVTPDHPEVAPLEGAFTVERVAADGSPAEYRLVPDTEGDAAGHGTACAAIIRRVAPEAALTSVRMLGPGLGGDGNALLAALRWAVAERFHVINLSLSSRKADYKAALHEIADEAYFNRVAIVAAAHNSPVRSFPWTFPSVISVGSHESEDTERIEVSADPPVEFFAAGVKISVPWTDGSSSLLSGNSFATPHVSGFVARILGKHPNLPVGEIKHVLAALSDNFMEISDPGEGARI